ncbi:chemotaxis protein CheC [Candidatus Epulonipiscium viviparus]|uniref:chemotaxis protein CheC n=1 Tax=Candidatus Epulonipiscium viviparus TaxID=420336 RepID=UPI00016C0EF6|nr:chemotaxis protein CheC [Candidatus Epulopiscium viviparus]
MIRLRDEITDHTLDALKEVANIGAGNAITALSQLLNKKISMNVVQVDVQDISELSKIYHEEDVFIVANVIEIVGDMRAVLMLVLEESSAKEIIFNVLGIQVNNLHELGEMELSLLSELGNILAGNYLNAIGTFVNLTISQSTPQIVMDMATAILSIPLIEFCDEYLDTLLIRTYFESDHMLLTGNYLFVLDKETERKIMNSMRHYYE